MRLGKDALVLTKCRTSMSAGFLSQSFNEVCASLGAQVRFAWHYLSGLGSRYCVLESGETVKRWTA
jgi:hypothetical protein